MPEAAVLIFREMKQKLCQLFQDVLILRIPGTLQQRIQQDSRLNIIQLSRIKQLQLSVRTNAGIYPILHVLKIPLVTAQLISLVHTG